MDNDLAKLVNLQNKMEYLKGKMDSYSEVSSYIVDNSDKNSGVLDVLEMLKVLALANYRALEKLNKEVDNIKV